MFKLILAFFLVTFTSNTYATSIVILVGKNYVFIGADSKEGGYNQPRFINKIEKTGKYLFAISGIYKNLVSGYFPAQNINHYLKSCKSFDNYRHKELNEVLKLLILKEVKNLRKSSKSLPYFRKTNFTFLKYCVVGFKNGFPYVYVTSFFFKDIDKDVITISDEYSIKEEEGKAITLGEEDAIGEFLTKGIDIPHDQVELINKLIGLEATAKPNMVGGKIRIVRAYNNQFTDIQ